jgi:transposase
VLECEPPNRKARRGKGKPDPIDAHLAVLAALRLDADRLPEPRAHGDREALRILLGARHELTVAGTTQTNRLRALLLGGEDTDRDPARVTLTDLVLVAMARRRQRRDASYEQAVRHGEIPSQALTLAISTGHREGWLLRMLGVAWLIAAGVVPFPVLEHRPPRSSTRRGGRWLGFRCCTP